MRIRTLSFFLFPVLLLTASCGPRAFTRGDYDDPERVELLDDKFNEADMQQLADSVVKSVVSCPYVKDKKQAPVVVMEKVENRTEEHIDMISLTDKIRVSLIKSRKVRFVNKRQRGTLEEEYKYSEGGAVDKKTAKRRGKQVGADYILGGELATNVQQVGSDKLVYYKLTMNLTNMETSIIDCTEEREIRKKYKKRHVGL